MNPTLTEADEGKRVVGADGEVLGTVATVDQGVAHVGPDAGDYESAKRHLRVEDAESDDFTFQETAVAERNAGEIVLRGES